MEWHFTDTLFADKSGGINPFRQFSVIAKIIQWSTLETVAGHLLKCQFFFLWSLVGF